MRTMLRQPVAVVATKLQLPRRSEPFVYVAAYARMRQQVITDLLFSYG
jgi:hypothetical protein